MLWDPLLKILQRSKVTLAAVGFGAGNPDLGGTEADAGNRCTWERGKPLQGLFHGFSE